MSYIGRVQLGDRLTLRCRTENNLFAPANPATAPWAKVWNSSGTLVTSFQLPAQDLASATGNFARTFLIDSTYAVGTYTVTYHYEAGRTAIGWARFQVVTGGDDDGSLLSLAFFERPEAGYVLALTESGHLMSGRNPTIPREESSFP